MAPSAARKLTARDHSAFGVHDEVLPVSARREIPASTLCHDEMCGRCRPHFRRQRLHDHGSLGSVLTPTVERSLVVDADGSDFVTEPMSGDARLTYRLEPGEQAERLPRLDLRRWSLRLLLELLTVASVVGADLSGAPHQHRTSEQRESSPAPPPTPLGRPRSRLLVGPCPRHPPHRRATVSQCRILRRFAGPSSSRVWLFCCLPPPSRPTCCERVRAPPRPRRYGVHGWGSSFRKRRAVESSRSTFCVRPQR